jgi:hypothetical protein
MSLLDKKQKKIVDAYVGGARICDILLKHKVHPPAIYRALDLAGVPRRSGRLIDRREEVMRRRQDAATQKALRELDIIADYLAGIRGAAIIKKYRTNWYTIREILDKHDVAIGGRGRPRGPSSDRERIERMNHKYNVEGQTYQQIGDAETPPITRERVRQILRAAGIPSLGNRPRGHEFTQAELDMLEDYKNDEWMPTKQVAAKHGMTVARMTYLARMAGLEARRWRSPAIKQRNEQILWHYHNSPHLTLADISKMYGLKNVNFPSQLAARSGGPMTRGGNRTWSKLDPRKVERVFREFPNATYKEWAEMIGCKQPYVWSLKKRYNVPITRQLRKQAS